MVQQISVDDGLSQGYVSSLAIDPDGFLWIGTLDGLNRYDGQNFEVTRYQEGVSTSLNDNRIVRLLFDDAARLWVATPKGIQVMDRFSGAAYTPECFQGKELSQVKDWLIDKNGAIWVLERQSLWLLEGISQGNSALEISKQLKARQVPLDFKGISCLAVLDDGLLLGTETGLVRMDLEGKHGSIYDARLPQEKVFRIWKEPGSERIWVYFAHSVCWIEGKQVQCFPLEAANPAFSVRGVKLGGKPYLFSKNQVYSWDGKGVSALPVEIEGGIVSAVSDRFGNIWIGTNAKGLVKVRPETFRFPVYLGGNSITKRMVPGRGGNLWVSGLVGPQKKNDQRYYRFSGDRPQIGPPIIELPHDRLAVGRHQDYWAGKRNALYHLTTDQQVDTTIFLQKLDPGTSIAGLYVDQRGSVLAFTQKGYLVVYDPGTGQEAKVAFPKAAATTEPAQNAIWLESKNGGIWLGTDLGLFHMEVLKQSPFYKVEYYGGKQRNASDFLSDAKINALEWDPSDADVMWVGTAHGLNRVNTRTGGRQQFSKQTGLPDDVVYSMLCSADSMLWMGTNRGLIEFSTRDFSYYYYTTFDGLPASEFNTKVAEKGSDGRFWFGSVNGLTGFWPDSIPHGNLSPRICFTAIRAIGRLQHPDSLAGLRVINIAGLQELELPDDVKAFQLEFALLDMTNPQYNQYRYRLVGKEQKWTYLGAVHVLDFAGLKAGAFVVEVQAWNYRSGWSQPTQIRLVIPTPWWRSLWAGLTYVGLALFALVWYIRRAGLGRQAIRQLQPAEIIINEDEGLFSENEADAHQEDTLLASIMQIIGERYMDPEFGVPELAKELLISSSQLHRKLVKMTGQSAGHTIRQYRLQKAEVFLLEYPDWSIAEVAQASGFVDPNYFSRAFSSEFACSPRVFRQKAGK